MKRLWKNIPPCLSDTLGFEAVLNQTSGMGIIDDSSRYKALRIGESRDARGGRRGEHGDRRGDFGGRGFEGRGFGGHGGHGGRGGRGSGDTRVVNSDIRNEDIIHGTQQKVLQAFDSGSQSYNPDFVLLAYAPSASMIGSDLDADADIIAQRSGLATACVNLHGDKDYLYGISCTLESMGKLLLKKQATIPGTVNLLGCNIVDWHKDTLAQVEAMAANAGFTVLSRWGAKESTENLKKASAASVNWVVNESGFRLARYMESEFGIPYIVGAPFGKVQSEALLQALHGTEILAPTAGQEPEVLVIGEQLTANALRQALSQRGYQNIRVLSFFDMEKSCMLPGDAKLSSEDDLAKQVQQSSVRLVLADPDYKAAAGRDVPWIGLPNPANQAPVNSVANFCMAGAALDAWLDNALN